jgi:hypothetical protein
LGRGVLAAAIGMMDQAGRRLLPDHALSENR